MPNDNAHTDLSGGPCQTPVEDLRKRTLEHYEEASMAISHWNSDVPKAINEYYDRLALSRTPDDPKAGDWWYKALDESLEHHLMVAQRAGKPDAMDALIDIGNDLRRALSSAAPRITGDSDKSDLPIANSVQLSEEMVEGVLGGIRVRGNTDRHHGIRTGIEKAKAAMIALLRPLPTNSPSEGKE